MTEIPYTPNSSEQVFSSAQSPDTINTPLEHFSQEIGGLDTPEQRQALSKLFEHIQNLDSLTSNAHQIARANTSEHINNSEAVQ